MYNALIVDDEKSILENIQKPSPGKSLALRLFLQRRMVPMPFLCWKHITLTF